MNNQEFKSFNQRNDQIDLGKIIRFLLMQSKLIIAFAILGFMIAFLNHISSTKQYSIQSLLQYEAVNQNILDPSVNLQSSLSSSRTNIDNLVTLYKSRTNLLKLIKDLKLNIDVRGLSESENIVIDIESKSKNELLTHNLNFSFSSNGYFLLDSDQNQLAYSNYGEYIYFNDLEIIIHSSNITEYKIINVDYRDPETLYKYMKYGIAISASTSKNSFMRNEGLITVSYVTHDTSLGKKIVNHANEIFLNQRILVETEKSRKAIEFINTNLQILKNDFENKKTKLNRYREKNQSIDVTLEIQSIVSKIEVLDQSLSSIDLAIAKAKDVYTENNTVFLNLINEKKIIEKQKQDVMSKVKLMPKEQQEYIDLFNDVELSQALYEELESRRLGLSILEASTIGDIRIVDKAYIAGLVKPQFNNVILFTILSILVGFAVAIIRGFFFLPISNPAELFDNNINTPIIGVLPYSDNNLDNDLILDSSIESTIVSINSISDNQTKNNVITITSPSSGNGKSFSSMKLAQGYAKLGKKVLLIDCDLKKGKIGKMFNKNNINKEVFLSIDETNIKNFAINEYLHIIPRIKNLHSSFQFLYDNKFRQKLDFFQDYFDHIIIDTAPVLSVADTSILADISDFNIVVTRHGLNKINQIKQVVDHFEQMGKSIDGIIYNAYEKPRGYYGYYEVYGNYSYQYYAEKYLDEAYDYEKN